MTRAHRISNLVAVALPFVVFLGAIVLLWNKAVGWTDLAIFVVHVRDHRLRHHDRLPPPLHAPRVRDLDSPCASRFAIAGSMAVEGDVITWVADHRKHHAFADEEGDPHSPHVDRERGLPGAVHGLWHAHVGWMLGDKTHGRASARRYAPDLIDDKAIRWVSRTFLFWVALTLLHPVPAGLRADAASRSSAGCSGSCGAASCGSSCCTT